MAESTMDEVKRLCSLGDFEQAREIARGIPDFVAKQALVEYFTSQPRPAVICHECGADLVEFDRRLLKWITVSSCAVCREREEKRERERQRQAARLRMLENIEPILSQCGIPPMYLTPPQKVVSIAFDLASSGKGYFFRGSPGTGKTTLACSIMRALVEQADMVPGYNGYCVRFELLPLFVYVPDLLTMIKATWDRGAQESESHLLKRIGCVPVLILDDLGVSHSSPWAHSIFDALIDRRYREKRRTIITSNLSLQGIADKFNGTGSETGSRIASRIFAMCETMNIKGPDRRLSKGEGL